MAQLFCIWFTYSQSPHYFHHNWQLLYLPHIFLVLKWKITTWNYGPYNDEWSCYTHWKNLLFPSMLLTIISLDVLRLKCHGDLDLLGLFSVRLFPYVLNSSSSSLATFTCHKQCALFLCFLQAILMGWTTRLPHSSRTRWNFSLYTGYPFSSFPTPEFLDAFPNKFVFRYICSCYLGMIYLFVRFYVCTWFHGIHFIPRKIYLYYLLWYSPGKICLRIYFYVSICFSKGISIWKPRHSKLSFLYFFHISGHISQWVLWTSVCSQAEIHVFIYISLSFLCSLLKTLSSSTLSPNVVIFIIFISSLHWVVSLRGCLALCW